MFYADVLEIEVFFYGWIERINKSEEDVTVIKM